MIISKQVTVTATPTELHQAVGNGCVIYLCHPQGGNDVTIGSSTVIFGAGVVMKGQCGFNCPIPTTEKLYGICESGKTQALGVLVIEQ
jgi:hypothetical protein